MKKNVFSRTLAVLASTVVLGAASMMSASAAGPSLTITSAEGKPGDTVTLEIIAAANDRVETIDASITFDEALTAVDVIKGANGDFSVQSAAMGNQLTIAGYTGNDNGVPDGAIGTMQFTIPADAAVGTVYNVEWAEVVDFDAAGESVAAAAEKINGTITVVAAETEAPATEAPTEEATTTTTKAPATGAPKTGTAGVAVAVAGLITAGATAVVLKKRH